MLDDYKLSKETHEIILNLILQDTFDGVETEENPIIYILGGQPGAGKSSLIEKDLSELPIQPVVINGDEFRKYHPQAQEIYEQHPDKFAEYTDADVRDWTQKIFSHAIENRTNIIFEGTMRTNAICETIKKLKNKGYYVNIQALAVPKLDSRLSIYGRYETQMEYDTVARFVSKESHDAAYNGMLNTLNQIEKEGLYDYLSIHTRKGEIIFQSSINAPKNGVVDAVIKYRNKVWGKSKYAPYAKRVEELKSKIAKRNGDTAHIKDLNSLKTKAQKMTIAPAAKELSELLYSLMNKKSKE